MPWWVCELNRSFARSPRQPFDLLEGRFSGGGESWSKGSFFPSLSSWRLGGLAWSKLACVSGLEVGDGYSPLLPLCSYQWPFTLLLPPPWTTSYSLPSLLPSPLSYSGLVDSRWPELESSNREKGWQSWPCHHDPVSQMLLKMPWLMLTSESHTSHRGAF